MDDHGGSSSETVCEPAHTTEMAAGRVLLLAAPAVAPPAAPEEGDAAQAGEPQQKEQQTSQQSGLHVYAREIDDEGGHSSLSVLAGRIKHGATVLDLGTGSGALGKYLSQRKGCMVDGVTYNAAEAQLAAPHYRNVVVADLAECELPALFPAQHYDYIVCADVLEHIRTPDRVARACHALLETDGRLLLSIPNTGYSGLIAELLCGEFRYREEGLLDETHVRHFTRRTLLRFLRDSGWVAEEIEPITRELTASEFRVAFDGMPPAVARYLLALPDARTYQFVVVARRSEQGEAQSVEEENQCADAEAPQQALFTTQLFLGTNGQYTEARKIVALGVIGKERQTLQFALPQCNAPLTGLRLDPADRPGFLHLYRMRLLDADANLLWQWTPEHGGTDALSDARMNELVLQPPWPAAGAAPMLLHGDDPWIELPVPVEALRAGSGGVFELELGWPMSADYLALARATGAARDELQRETRASARRIEELEREIRASANRIGELKATLDSQSQQLEAQRASITSSAGTVEALNRQQQTLSGERDRLSAQLETLHARNSVLQNQKQALQAQKQELLLRCNTLSRERDGAVSYIETIQNSTVFRVTRPAVHAKMALDRMLGRDSARAQDDAAAVAAGPLREPVEPPAQPVNVIVPVYRGLADTRLCLESVLASRCRMPFRLIVINDASPEPEVTQYLRDAAARESRIVLIENEENLGFVGTVNRGMALSESHDVLLLNSDTEVANDWLDRLRAAAYSDRRIASVTPFSNNATICSYPRFCEDNELPPGWNTAQLDALFAQVNAGQTVEVPTGIGFCMYIRRDCLDAVGLFDVENFGKGYGEENDFCQRALKAGWSNLHALDTFVMHSGGVSFGASKSPREAAAMQTIRRLHPSYETQVHTFIAADPARLARLSVDLARATVRGLPVVLLVLHDRAGGVLRHVHELAEHVAGQAVLFTLKPAGGGDVLLEFAAAGEAFALAFNLPHQFDELVAALRALDVRLIHFHHLLGHADLIGWLPERLGVPYDVTAHDFFTVCPQITFTFSSPQNAYCGEQGVEQCTRCLQRSPAPGGLDIESWREKYTAFLRGARNVLAPSRDTVAHLVRYVPGANLQFVPHTDIDPDTPLPQPKPARLEETARLKVAVIGALSQIKGADVLEDAALLAAKTDARIDFHLIGFAYRSLRTQPRARLTVHGEYKEDDLPALLEWLEPDLVWFPALAPETYSYTLSACLKTDLPIVAPDIGAFAERLVGRGWSWICAWNQTPAQWLDFFEDIRVRHFVAGKAPAPVIRIAALSAGEQASSTAAAAWTYERDYLAGITAQRAQDDERPAFINEQEPQTQAPVLDRSFIAAHLPGGPKAGLHVARGIKGRMLHITLRLRAAPGLSRVARSIPLRWQTRFKSWLRA